MGEIIHGVDAPCIAGGLVAFVFDSVEDGIAHVEVGRGHVDFGAEDVFAVGEISIAHLMRENVGDAHFI